VAGVAVLVGAVVVTAAVVLGLKSRDHTPSATPGTPTGSPASAAAASSAGPPGPLTVVAHRGGWETFPRESLPAITAAAEAGNIVQFDVLWTADDVPVLIREETTKPPSEADRDTPMACTGGPYVIAQTPWPVLRSKCRSIASASDDGRRYPIATLDEAAKAVAAVKGVWFYPELSATTASPARTAAVLATLTEHGLLDRTVVGSFYPEQLRQIRSQAAAQHLDLPVMLYLPARSGPARPSAASLADDHYYGVTIELGSAAKSYVKALRKRDLVVMAWNLNERGQWVAARRAGVQQVFTDTPGAYREWAQEKTPEPARSRSTAPVARPGTTPSTTPTSTPTPTATPTPTVSPLVTPVTEPT
jgi:glycerophosphoryl diester phosphodiesterase